MGAPHLTTEELAARLRRSPRTLERWRHDGKGPRSLPGIPVVYPVAEVEAWEQRQLAAREPQPA
jgi:DNA-binding transcriptional regulator YiaG